MHSLGRKERTCKKRGGALIRTTRNPLQAALSAQSDQARSYTARTDLVHKRRHPVAWHRSTARAVRNCTKGGRSRLVRRSRGLPPTTGATATVRAGKWRTGSRKPTGANGIGHRRTRRHGRAERGARTVRRFLVSCTQRSFASHKESSTN